MINDTILKELGFNSIAELASVFVDRGDFIELKTPIRGIVSIQKEFLTEQNWNAAEHYAKTLRIGDFNDWHIPYAEQLELLYYIKDICQFGECDGVFWSGTSELHQEFDNIYEYWYDYQILYDFDTPKYEGLLRKYQKTHNFGEILELNEPNKHYACGIRCVRMLPQYNKTSFYDFVYDIIYHRG